MFIVRIGVVLLAPFVLFGQTPDLKPVPSTWVKGDQLVVPDLNFSVQCPKPTCDWNYGHLKADGVDSTMFTVKDRDKPDEGALILFVMDTPSGGERMDTWNGMKPFLKNMQKTLPKGWQLAQDAIAKPSTIPVPGSQMATTTLQVPDSGVVHGFFYFSQGRLSYVFCAYAAETEPADYTNFVRSFRLLDVSANAPIKPTSAINSGTSLIFLFAIAGAIIDWRYKRRGGVKPTRKDYLYLAGAVLICIALLVWLASLGRSPEAIGSLTGFFLVATFAVWEFGRWRIRKRKPIVPTLRMPLVADGPTPEEPQEQPPTATISCANCGQTVGGDEKFCGGCGKIRVNLSSTP